MKILLLSDSHGNLRGVQSAVDKYGRNADIIVHCGDGTRGEADWLKDNCINSSVVCVRGNCDFSSMLNNIEYLNVCGKKIMITHGHIFNVKFTYEDIAYRAKMEGVDLVFFGHTHNPTDTVVNGVRLINPGSSGYYDRNCATVEIDDKGNVLVNHLKLPNN